MYHSTLTTAVLYCMLGVHYTASSKCVTCAVNENQHLRDRAFSGHRNTGCSTFLPRLRRRHEQQPPTLAPLTLSCSPGPRCVSDQSKHISSAVSSSSRISRPPIVAGGKTQSLRSVLMLGSSLDVQRFSM